MKHSPIRLLAAVCLIAGCSSGTTTKSVVGPSTCTVVAATSLPSFPPAGGDGTIHVSGPPDCSWSIVGKPNWIVVTGPLTGLGSANVAFFVAPNAGASSRTTVVLVNATQFVIVQDGLGAGTVLTAPPPVPPAPPSPPPLPGPTPPPPAPPPLPPMPPPLGVRT